MITIGVTGGVGSGKSEILGYLEKEYNGRILMSDNAAKDLERPGGVLYGPLIDLLERYARGKECSPLLDTNGEIVKAEMARRIFENAELLKEVNMLVHPAVNQYILDEIDREREEGKREFFVLESALLVENGYDRIVDSMWYIYCSEEERYRRLKASRGYSDEKIRSIIGRQVSDQQFRASCDIVIDNTRELTAPDGALRQVDRAIRLLRDKFSDQNRG